MIFLCSYWWVGWDDIEVFSCLWLMCCVVWVHFVYVHL